MHLIDRQTRIEDKECTKYVSTGLLGSGNPLIDEMIKNVENKVNDFNPEDSSEAWSQFELDGKRKISGHFCPVFFVMESVAEDKIIDKIIEYLAEDE